LEHLKKTFIPFFIGAFTPQDNAAEVDVIFFTLASLNFLIYVPNQSVFVIERIKIIHLHFAKKNVLSLISNVLQCTELRFASFLSSGFITAILVNPPERKQAKCTSVQCTVVNGGGRICQHSYT
jgi:uncharacterized membrane protein